MALGVARLHFDADVLDLFPSQIPAVEGLKLYQQHFANSRELIITVTAADADAAKSAAQSIAETLRQETNLVSDATWQPPWIERPEQMAELIAYLWLNQPPQIFQPGWPTSSRKRTSPMSLTLRATVWPPRSRPADLAQLSYDPFGLTQLPADVTGAAPGFGQGQDIFASSDGTFRIIFVKVGRGIARIPRMHGLA